MCAKVMCRFNMKVDSYDIKEDEDGTKQIRGYAYFKNRKSDVPVVLTLGFYPYQLDNKSIEVLEKVTEYLHGAIVEVVFELGNDSTPEAINEYRDIRGTLHSISFADIGL